MMPNQIPVILPHERVFPIEVGRELFKLSGASLSSDAPSYFSQYFLCQLKQADDEGIPSTKPMRTLHIDRDPLTFRDIALHLQGYHVQPKDGTHFVRLFADAQFYCLPRLISQLYEESIFISIGHREFQIPRCLLTSPANSPNYFSLDYAALFSRPDNLFPGLEREGLLRPPAILPPSVPNRSADNFAQLLNLLMGYPVQVRDEAHREALLRDARYFHFKGLEQQLLPHSISFNSLRGCREILLRLENVQKRGLSAAWEPNVQGQSSGVAWARYARPSVDEEAAELIVEIGDEATRIHFSADGPKVEFLREAKAKVAKLLEIVSGKLVFPFETQASATVDPSQVMAMTPPPGQGDLIPVSLEPESAIVLDGGPYSQPAAAAAAAGAFNFIAGGAGSGKKRRFDDGFAPAAFWNVKTGQWRVRLYRSEDRLNAVDCVLVAVKLDALSSELGRNRARPFLGN